MGRRVELTGDLVEEPGVSTLDLDDLTGDDGQRVEHAMAKFEAAMRDLTPDAWAEAGEANAEAYRQREPSMPSGFEKFLVMNVSESGAHIWEDHHDAVRSLPLLEFAYGAITSRGWRASGNATPLGRQGSYLVATCFEVKQAAEASAKPKRRGLFGAR